MRDLRFIFTYGSILTALIPSTALPQESSEAAGSASAEVIRPIAAQPRAVLAFGALVVDRVNGGEVIVSAEGNSTSYSGSVRSACGTSPNCASHPAHFTVTGSPGLRYSISLPVIIYATGRNSGRTLEVTDLVSRSSGMPGPTAAGRLDLDGFDDFFVGGTLSVPPAAPTDFYSTDLPVVLTYE